MILAQCDSSLGFETELDSVTFWKIVSLSFYATEYLHPPLPQFIRETSQTGIKISSELSYSSCTRSSKFWITLCGPQMQYVWYLINYFHTVLQLKFHHSLMFLEHLLYADTWGAAVTKCDGAWLLRGCWSPSKSKLWIKIRNSEMEILWEARRASEPIYMPGELMPNSCGNEGNRTECESYIIYTVSRLVT